MKPAKQTPDEPSRLASLRDLNILDTPAEERFDRITRIACKALGVPIALVSLVDEGRQWFKSNQGLEAMETPRDISFCGHAIEEEQMLVVGDAGIDDRFADNPLVTGETHIRFYAGKPIKSPDGKNIGTLCVIDTVSRNIGAEERQVLEDLASIVETELGAAALTEAQLELRNQLEESERRSAIDPVTRCWTRAVGRKLLDKEIERSRRSREQISVLILQIDQIIDIQQSYGDAIHNAVLRRSAELIRGTMRRPDTLVRFEGDTFLAIMPKCDARTLAQVVERIHERLKQEAFETPDGPLWTSVSVGPHTSVVTKETSAGSILAQARSQLAQA